MRPVAAGSKTLNPEESSCLPFQQPLQVGEVEVEEQLARLV